MKFNIVVGNPPYQRGLHTTFLQLCFNILSTNGILIFLHPSTEFISLKKHFKKQSKLINLIKNNIISLSLIDSKTHQIFPSDVRIAVLLSITILSKNHNNGGHIKVKLTDGTNHIFTDINDVNQYGTTPPILDLFHKFKNIQSIWNYKLKQKNNSKYYVSFPGIRGDLTEKHTIFAEQNAHILDKNCKIHFHKEPPTFGFNTKAEAINFIDYLKTKFSRFLFSLLSINANINRGELKLIPWLDFKQPWTDEELYKYFKLNPEEIQLIEKTIS